MTHTVKLTREDCGAEQGRPLTWFPTSTHETKQAQELARLRASHERLLVDMEVIANQCGDFATRQPALDYASIGNIARAAIALARQEEGK